MSDVSGYLPPVVVDILGTDRDLQSTLADATALLGAFGKQEAKASLGVDTRQVQSGIAGASAELAAFARRVADANLGADASRFWSEIAALRAEVGAMSPLDINVDANTAAAMAKLAALRGAFDLASIDNRVTAGGAGGGGDAGLGAAAAAAAAGGGKGGGGMSLLSMLGFGAGAGLFGMAGFGSLGSLAGLGPEHLLMTGVGLAGNAAGGVLGGGLLGLGSLGVTGVGMGTDAAGTGQALNDTKAVVAAQNALNQAIAVYGKNSTQAKNAQAQLNYTLSSFNQIARQSVLQAANTAQGFHDMFNTFTGQAEAIGATILTQAMQVGEKFLPILGKYATANTQIIKNALQPLFSWMTSGSGGLGIFTELEQKFQSDLPTAMRAFDNGVELLLRTIGLIAPQTGGLISSIARLTAKFNGAGWGQWSGEVNKLIGDFRNWEALIKILIEDIAALFHADAGTAGTIVTTLTQMLTKLHEWETSVSGQASMHNMFTAHRQEIVQLLQLLPTLVSVFAQLEMAISPSLTTAFAALVGFVNDLLHIPVAGQIAAWALGFGLLASKLNVISMIRQLGAALSWIQGGGIASTFANLSSSLSTFTTWVGVTALRVQAFGARLIELAAQGVTWAGQMIASGASFAAQWIAQLGRSLAEAAVWVAEHAAMAASFIAENLAMAAAATAAFIAENAATLGIAAAIALLVTAIVYAATHWKQVWADIQAVTAAVWDWMKGAASAVAGALTAVWDGIVSVAKTVWNGLLDFFKQWWPLLLGVATGGVGLIVGLIVKNWSTISSATSSAWNAILGVFKAVWGGISGAVSAGAAAVEAVWRTVQSVAQATLVSPVEAVLGVWQSVWGGITAAVEGAWNVISGIFSAIASGVSTIINDVGKVTSAVSSISNAGSSIVSHIPVVGGVLSHIPGLADGGLVTKPTLAWVGEAGYPEMVIPLKNGLGSLGSGVQPLPTLPTVQQQGGFYGGNAGALSPTYHITVTAPTGDGKDISASLKKVLDEHDRQLMARLRAGSAY